MSSKCSLLEAFKPRKYMKLSNEVLQELKEEFKKNQYPTKEFLDEISRKCVYTSEQIKNWFRAERKKKFQLGAMSYQVDLIFEF